MKLKVGYKVRIKSLDWYYENTDYSGNIDCGYHYFTEDMTKYCGKVMTIISRTELGVMLMDNDTDNNYWTDEMIEDVVEPNDTEMIPLEKAAEWVKNAFIGTFGEGLAENIKQEFIKAMKK